MQRDVDEYLASGPTTRHLNPILLHLGQESKINVGVHIGFRQAKTTPTITQERRLAWIKELLTGDSAAFPTGSPASCCCFRPAADQDRGRQTTAIAQADGETRIALGKEPIPVPEPFASQLNYHLHNRPNLRTAGGAIGTPWLFPSSRPGRHIDPQAIMHRLRWLGVNCSAPETQPYKNSFPRYPLLWSPKCSATATKSPRSTPQKGATRGPDTRRREKLVTGEPPSFGCARRIRFPQVRSHAARHRHSLRMANGSLIAWLLDSDPALRWQVERDLVGEPAVVWEATRTKIGNEGFGARLLALQDSDGQWAGGAFFPADFDFDGPEAAEGAGRPWTATTWTLNSLREWGLDASVLCGRRTVELLAENSRWEYEDLPYWSGEVDCCINAWTVANGVWLGADITGIVDWFLEHRLPDGGWNCEWVEGSTRSSFHSTLNSLKGLLAYDAVTGGTDETCAARRSGQEYLLHCGAKRSMVDLP